jgi:class III poly(R)-hydroxyalkanoic acid synthase PhaE subunit
MSERSGNEAGPNTMLEAWLRTSREFWQTTAEIWQRNLSQPQDSSAEDEHTTHLHTGTGQAAIKAWNDLFSVMAEAGTRHDLDEGIPPTPALLLKIVQPAWKGLFRLQEEWLERTGRIGQSLSSHRFNDLHQEAVNIWKEIYETEFREFLKFPQVGLTRFYQERLNEATDKFNLFSGAMAEFISVLYQPLERSLEIMQERLSAMVETGELPVSSHDYYHMWIGILESHYETLFRSPEYLQTLAGAMDAMSDYRIARQAMLQDMLQDVPVPTRKEMDELYKDVYLLKKRVKDLERQVKQQGAGEPERIGGADEAHGRERHT